MNPPGRQSIHQGRNDGAGSSCKPHGPRLLWRRRKALHGLEPRPLDDHVALAVLGKGPKPKAVHNASHPGMHSRPEPGGAKVEALGRGVPLFVHRQDAPPEAVPGLEKLELNPLIQQKSRRIKPRKPSPDDGNSRSHWFRLAPVSPAEYRNAGSKSKQA
jgi:hypothetical protein